MGAPLPTRTDVAVVGAGLAGLCAALHLARAGLDVAVPEASDDVGGRVRTDLLDGLRLDRGFQVYSTAYPEAARLLDHEELALRAFLPGALVRVGGGLHLLADPRRRPGAALSTLRAPVGPLSDKLRVAALALVDGLPPASRLRARPDRTAGQALADRGFSPAVVDRFLRPFLSGVLLERELATSSVFLDLVWRTFVRGASTVPAAGMARSRSSWRRGSRPGRCGWGDGSPRCGRTRSTSEPTGWRPAPSSSPPTRRPRRSCSDCPHRAPAR